MQYYPPRMSFQLLMIIFTVLLYVHPVFGASEERPSHDVNNVAPAAPQSSFIIRNQNLDRYNVDISQSSVSGLSAGGYMAVHFFVSHSNDVLGAGVFAGGPYGCSQGNLNDALNKCMNHSPPITQSDINSFYETARRHGSENRIDSLDNLQNRKLFVFSGLNDQTVQQEVTDWVDNWFEKAGMPASNILYKDDIATGHTQPTMEYGNVCSAPTASPWMSDCDYDGAGEALQHIYGVLNERSPVTDSSGIFIEFPQNEFFQPQNLSPSQLKERFSMNEFGYAYVPQSCIDGELCRIHVVFHGCKQIYNRNPDGSDFNPDDASNPYGLQMVMKAGYNEWANTNNLIILYPQAQKTAATSFIGGLGNPRGCYDWWAYINGTADLYATKENPQIGAVYRMMQRIAGAPVAEFDTAGQDGAHLVIEGTLTFGGANLENLKVQFLYPDDNSTGLKIVDEFDRSSGKFRHSEPWVQDKTTYRVQLVIEYSDKSPDTIEGPEIQVGDICKEWTQTNSNHFLQGRATSCYFWFHCAVGSGDFLGFGMTTTTLMQDDPHKEIYKRGSCTQ